MSRPGSRSQNMPPPGSLSGLREKKVMEFGSHPSLGLHTPFLFPENTPGHSGLSRTKRKHSLFLWECLVQLSSMHPEESAPFQVGEFPGVRHLLLCMNAV